MSKVKISSNDLYQIEPQTENQDKVFKLWDEGENLILAGSAGTGKTFVALYLALDEMLNEPEYDKIIIVRSIVSVREIGYLPGKLEEKTAVFETPYRMICDELFEGNAAYNKMINSHQIQFETTSYIRGKTFDRAIIVVDEMQNLNFHELDSIMTRVGENCRIIFCGDFRQSDLKRNELLGWLKILERMKEQIRIKNY